MLENTQLLKTMSGSEGPPGSARRKPRGGSWRGDPRVLADILSAFATKPSFVQYSEDLGSPIDVAKLSAHAPLVNQLRELNPPLIFSQTCIMEALEIVREERKFDLGGDDDAVVSDWKTTTAKRIRCMCRHVTQSEAKSPRVAWLRQFSRPELQACATDAFAGMSPRSGGDGALCGEAGAPGPTSPEPQAVEVATGPRASGLTSPEPQAVVAREVRKSPPAAAQMVDLRTGFAEYEEMEPPEATLWEERMSLVGESYRHKVRELKYLCAEANARCAFPAGLPPIEDAAPHAQVEPESPPRDPSVAAADPEPCQSSALSGVAAEVAADPEPCQSSALSGAAAEVGEGEADAQAGCRKQLCW